MDAKSIIRLACLLVAVDSPKKAIALKVVKFYWAQPGSTRNGDVTDIFPMKMTSFD